MQFRKFEIDAMVDGVCTKILANAKYVEAQFKNLQEYADIEKALSDLAEAKEADKKAGEKVERLRKLLTADIESFNDQYGNEVFKLAYNTSYGSYSDKLTFETSVNGYHSARYTIASELAVALLPRDARDNSMQIVSNLADKFIVDLN